VKRLNLRNIEPRLRDLTVLAIVAVASLILAISIGHIYFAPVFAVEAVAAIVLAVWIANAPH
jgi:hypothetical protein